MRRGGGFRGPGIFRIGGMRNYRSSGRRGNSGYAIYLAMELIGRIIQLERKPPVTLFLVALNVVIHFQPSILVGFLPSMLLFGKVSDVCLNPSAILFGLRRHYLNWTRLFGSALIHGDDIHLWYNMGSLLIKGASLEPTMGSINFLGMVLGIWTLSHTLVVLIAYILLNFGFQTSYQSCSIGFSAVIFGLKYVLNRRLSNTRTQVLFFTVDSKWATWAELLLVQILISNASFLGHLSGILAGVIWVDGYSLYTRIKGYMLPDDRGSFGGGGRRRYTYARGRTGPEGPLRDPLSLPRQDNLGGVTSLEGPSQAPPILPQDEILEDDEMMQEAIRLSLLETDNINHDDLSPNDDWVDLGSRENEIRRRRLSRFGDS